MKFDCGETKEEKYARLSQWHKHLCILPIQLKNHDCRWFEYILRKGTFHGASYANESGWWKWEYKEREHVI